MDEIRLDEDNEADQVGMDEWWCMWFKCKKCGEENITWNFNFCPDCGVKIKWIKNEIILDTQEQRKAKGAVKCSCGVYCATDKEGE